MNHAAPLLALASQSPRRRQLLDQIGVEYTTLLVSIDESVAADESPETYVVRLAREKATAGRDLIVETGEWPESLPVLGADTTVVVDGKILGKPRNRTQGLDMLRRLSGRWHQVLTGVALATVDGLSHRIQVSSVEFEALSPHALSAYWESGEPADKAGAYAIQGLAAGFVREIRGSFSGVMGLPLHETVVLLREAALFPVESMFATEDGNE